MSLKVSYIEPTEYVLKSRSKNNASQFLIDIFVENGHKKTFLENLVKDYNDKKKNSDSSNYTNSKKMPWLLNIGPKIRKEFKKINKDITSTSGKNLQRIQCQNKPKLL